MKHRFRFFAELSGEDQFKIWKIGDTEFKHLKNVLRLTEGCEVEVFNAKGISGVGTITQMTNRECIVRCEAYVISPQPDFPLIAIISALKAHAIDEILPALTELGCDEIHIYFCDGSVKFPITSKIEDRRQRILLSACKQSKRSLLPLLRHWDSLQAVYEGRLKNFCGSKFVLAPEAHLSFHEINDYGQGVAFVCGSEKGFSRQEEDFLSSHGFVKALLGKHILRASTAAIAAAAVLSAKIPLPLLPSRHS